MPYQPGDILLEKYRIEALLGQGAFGDVYRATHLELRVPRAVKVLRRDAPGIGSHDFNEAQERFRLEAQLGAALNTPTPHPNLLQVHDLRLAEDLLLLEMEYAPGGDLVKRILAAKTPAQLFPILSALLIAEQVADGLAILHAHDIVHRDLKPANILFDDQEHAKLADFGLAQVPGGPSQRSKLSNPKPHPGTPGYMSPEQENSASYLKPASDIYTLGLVLFEMLTGRLYTSLRPGTSISKLRADIPAGLDDLLARMLAKDAEGRPWDGTEVAGLLREARENLNRAVAKPASPAKPPVEVAAAWEQTPEAAQIRARTAAAGQALLAEKAARLEAERLAQEAEAAELARQQAADRKKRLEAEAAALEMAIEVEKAARLEAERRLQAAKKVPPAAAGLEVLQLAPGVSMQFVRVPAGEFLMGSDPKKDNQAGGHEQPQHTVYLPEYLIGKYPVTNGQYLAFVQAVRYEKPPYWDGEILKDKREHPVVYVTWVDALAFCAWLSKVSSRQVGLPSEAEWEKAARGTDGRIYPWGNEAPDAQRCNFNNNVKDTTPVGKYSPQGDSPYLCADMAGNVWEWTRTISDDKFNYPYKSDDGREDLRQEDAWRAIRGGAFNLSEVRVRCASHNGDDQRFGWDLDLGFRVVVSQVLLS